MPGRRLVRWNALDGREPMRAARGAARRGRTQDLANVSTTAFAGRRAQVRLPRRLVTTTRGIRDRAPVRTTGAASDLADAGAAAFSGRRHDHPRGRLRPRPRRMAGSRPQVAASKALAALRVSAEAKIDADGRAGRWPDRRPHHTAARHAHVLAGRARDEHGQRDRRDLSDPDCAARVRDRAETLLGDRRDAREERHDVLAVQSGLGRRRSADRSVGRNGRTAPRNTWSSTGKRDRPPASEIELPVVHRHRTIGDESSSPTGTAKTVHFTFFVLRADVIDTGPNEIGP